MGRYELGVREISLETETLPLGRLSKEFSNNAETCILNWGEGGGQAAVKLVEAL
jgi:hypothetical protein